MLRNVTLVAAESAEAVSRWGAGSTTGGTGDILLRPPTRCSLTGVNSLGASSQIPPIDHAFRPVFFVMGNNGSNGIQQVGDVRGDWARMWLGVDVNIMVPGSAGIGFGNDDE